MSRNRNIIHCDIVYRPDNCPDVVTGVILKCSRSISLLGDIDYRSGLVKCGSSTLRIMPCTILCYPKSIGSTVGPYSLYALKLKYGEPHAIVCVDPDILTIVGAVLFDILLIRVSQEDFEKLDTGLIAEINLNEKKIVLHNA